MTAAIIEFGRRPLRFQLDLNDGEDFSQPFQGPTDGSLHGAVVTWVFENGIIWTASEDPTTKIWTFTKPAADSDALTIPAGTGFSMFVTFDGQKQLSGRGVVARG